jgi:cell division protease FtsH
VVVGEGSTGAANDLATATELATRMVREYGSVTRQSDRSATPRAGLRSSALKSEFSRRTYAEETQRVIDREVARLLREAEQRAVDLVAGYRDPLDGLTLLLQKETIDGDEVTSSSAGACPGQSRTGALRSAPCAPGLGQPRETS